MCIQGRAEDGRIHVPLIENRIGFEENLSDFQSRVITVGGMIGLAQPQPTEGRAVGKGPSLPGLTMELVLLFTVIILATFGLIFKTKSVAGPVTYPNGTTVMGTIQTSLIAPESMIVVTIGILGFVLAPYILPYLRKGGVPHSQFERWITELLTLMRERYLGCYMLAHFQTTDPRTTSALREIFPDFFVDRKKYVEVTLPTEFLNTVGEIVNYVDGAAWSRRAFLVNAIVQAGQPTGMFPQRGGVT